MKTLQITIAFLVVLAGCNQNVSKEGRIRKLETQSNEATSKLRELEDRVEALESSIGKNQGH